MGIIRLLLAMAVFNSHFPVVDFPVVDGHEAVLAFFVISGFYMAFILDRAYSTPRNFYYGRFLSLYPMYVFALTLSVALIVSIDIHPMTTLEKLKQLMADPVAFGVMLWSSICLIGQEFLFSLAPGQHGGLTFVENSRNAIWPNAPLIQGWSLSLEFVFYLLAPFLVRLKTPSLIIITAASLIAKVTVTTTGLHEIVFYRRFFPTEFWLFGCGILAYRTSRFLPSGKNLMGFLLFASFILLIGMMGSVPEQVLPYALPIITIIALPHVFHTFSSFQYDRFIGKISYPFYLLHFSVIAIFESAYDEPNGWLILIVTLVLAIATHLLFTPGMEHLKQKLRTPKSNWDTPSYENQPVHAANA